jgi:hypothetical protein
VPLQRPWHYSAHQSDSGRNHHQHTRAHELTSATPASLQHAWHWCLSLTRLATINGTRVPVE